MSAKRDYPPPPDVITGRVAWVFGDDFDIDLVTGVENIKSYDAAFLRGVVMQAYDPGFADRVRPGDVIVGGRNFGYGHPHYPPMVALRDLGIAAVLAESFSPGFWRGETYNGMPLITVPGITAAVATGDDLSLDWRAAAVTLSGGRTLQGTPPAERVARVIEAGGSLKLLLAEHART
ncbi:3-isopropylmalate dehydratase small subunit [Pseudonocardia sp. Ae168_Ps1]|uniref:3-isopropylmalate dehydratase n=1 Tax=unclassified Pseudonocardia TaxID=2619320 RepID=UPI00094AA9C0|nr:MULTISPECIES: 3-isopropylmalate dehydratase [unclassified Pseudonocardia]OLL70970.1 3-isopropylmalate dehydratase small subunit [Pseudonocardia sp. Ae168_Ps1]OLL77479.1 3-isopropylmalate dehydratase small subunit [Pseudonocardia sp. Ae150A_Ps1]OLL88408.1 3-isopropylmalate dehydratase small subunit [Pseudonocardia sp. Ae263_Ps1]OLL91569.1 3-isopropylmalate dehydratase small subunit [Pseudonocardia sp. Ae356_Ps1]